MKQTAATRHAIKQEFALAPLQAWVWALPVALWGVLLLMAFLTGSHEQSPHNPVPWWLVVLFGTALLPAGLLTTLSHREINIKGNQLELAGGIFFAKKVQIGDLALDRARILNLEEHTEYAPRLQLLALGMPGFKVGYYLLRDQSRVFCLLTARQPVLYLPVRNGKSPLLLSPERPRALLDALAALEAKAGKTIPGHLQEATP